MQSQSLTHLKVKVMNAAHGHVRKRSIIAPLPTSHLNTLCDVQQPRLRSQFPLKFPALQWG